MITIASSSIWATGPALAEWLPPFLKRLTLWDWAVTPRLDYIELRLVDSFPYPQDDWHPDLVVDLFASLNLASADIDGGEGDNTAGCLARWYFPNSADSRLLVATLLETVARSYEQQLNKESSHE